MVSVMTRIFITGIILARAVGGRKGSMVVYLQDLNLRDGGKSLLKCPRLRDEDPVLIKRPLLLRRPPLRDGDQSLVK